MLNIYYMQIVLFIMRQNKSVLFWWGQKSWGVGVVVGVRRVGVGGCWGQENWSRGCGVEGVGDRGNCGQGGWGA